MNIFYINNFYYICKKYFMKIREGFVSNSSSTSFTISMCECGKETAEEDWLCKSCRKIKDRKKKLEQIEENLKNEYLR